MKIVSTRYAAAALAAVLAVPGAAHAQVPASISTPGKVESRLGTLIFKDGKGFIAAGINDNDVVATSGLDLELVW